jgi:hypothetical protein
VVIATSITSNCALGTGLAWQLVAAVICRPVPAVLNTAVAEVPLMSSNEASPDQSMEQPGGKDPLVLALTVVESPMA